MFPASVAKVRVPGVEPVFPSVRPVARFRQPSNARVLWMSADLVQDAALDTSTVARVTTKLYSAARPRVLLKHL